MDIFKKLGWVVLAVTLSCGGPILAQEGPRDVAVGPSGDEVMGPVGEGFVDPGAVGEPDGSRRMGPGRERDGWRDGRGGRGRREFAMSRILSNPEIQQKVGVTPEQVAKIRGQETAFRKTSIQQRADLEVKRLDLQELLAAEKPDRAAIDRQLQAISASRLAMDKSRIDFRLNMKDALTPEQREKLKQAMKDRWEGRRGPDRRGPGRGQRGSKPGGGSAPGSGQPPANSGL
jgi:Spy/CpxP family protein refolding chaperone